MRPAEEPCPGFAERRAGAAACLPPAPPPAPRGRWALYSRCTRLREGPSFSAGETAGSEVGGRIQWPLPAPASLSPRGARGGVSCPCALQAPCRRPPASPRAVPVQTWCPTRHKLTSGIRHGRCKAPSPPTWSRASQPRLRSPAGPPGRRGRSVVPCSPLGQQHAAPALQGTLLWPDHARGVPHTRQPCVDCSTSSTRSGPGSRQCRCQGISGWPWRSGGRRGPGATSPSAGPCEAVGWGAAAHVLAPSPAPHHADTGRRLTCFPPISGSRPRLLSRTSYSSLRPRLSS